VNIGRDFEAERRCVQVKQGVNDVAPDILSLNSEYTKSKLKRRCLWRLPLHPFTFNPPLNHQPVAR
jgi:hypothetical protein